MISPCTNWRHSPAWRTPTSPERRNLVLVDTDTGPLGLLVDAILDASELVTRPAGRYLKRIPGVAGIGLLGNGSVIPLLDVAELARSPNEQHLRAAAEARTQAQAQRRSRVLVVDDSLSVRRAIASLLEDQGYEVVLARDGLEAVKLMDVSRPDVLLTDLEMPNMNGLELAAHVRSRDELAGLTIIMITSRSMDKHRRQAMSAGVNVYLNKPYYRPRVAATRGRSRYRARRETRGCRLGRTRDLP